MSWIGFLVAQQNEADGDDIERKKCANTRCMLRRTCWARTRRAQ